MTTISLGLPYLNYPMKREVSECELFNVRYWYGSIYQVEKNDLKSRLFGTENIVR